MLFFSAIFLLLHRPLLAFTALALGSVKTEFYVIKKMHSHVHYYIENQASYWKSQTLKEKGPWLSYLSNCGLESMCNGVVVASMEQALELKSNVRSQVSDRT